MYKDETVTQRLDIIINKIGENVNSFSGKIGVTRSTIAGAISRNKGVNTDLVQKISDVFPSINIEWLITGQGEMLKPTSENNSRNVHNTGKISGGVMTGDNNAPISTSISSDNSDNEQRILLLEARVSHLDEMLKEKERFIQVLLANK